MCGRLPSRYMERVFLPLQTARRSVRLTEVPPVALIDYRCSEAMSSYRMVYRVKWGPVVPDASYRLNPVR